MIMYNIFLRCSCCKIPQYEVATFQAILIIFSVKKRMYVSYAQLQKREFFLSLERRALECEVSSFTLCETSACKQKQKSAKIPHSGLKQR
jgi:hypothetical protein